MAVGGLKMRIAEGLATLLSIDTLATIPMPGVALARQPFAVPGVERESGAFVLRIGRAMAAIVQVVGLASLILLKKTGRRVSHVRRNHGFARSRSWAAMPAAMAAGSFERIAGIPTGQTSSVMRSSATPASRRRRVNRARLLAEPMSPT